MTESLIIRRVRRIAYAVSSLKSGGLCTPYVWNGPTAPLGNCLAVFARKRDAIDWCDGNTRGRYRIVKVSIEE